MNIHSAEFLLSFVAMSLIGIFVFIKDSSRRENRKFIAFVSSLAVWQLANFLIITSRDAGQALFVGRIFGFGIIFIYPTFFDLTLTLTEAREKHKKSLLIAYVSAGLLYILNWFSHFPAGLLEHEHGFHMKAGPIYNVFIALLFGYVLYSFYLMFKGLRSSSGHIRNRIKYILSGSAIVLAGSIIDFLPMYGVSIYPVGTLSLLVFALILAYTVIEHRLVEFEYNITGGLIYGGTLVMFGSAFTFLLYLADYLVPAIDSKLISISLFFLMILPSYFFLRNFLPRAEFNLNIKLSKKYQLQHKLSSLIKNISDYSSLKNLVEDVSSIIGTSVSLIFLKEKSIQAVTPEGFNFTTELGQDDYVKILNEFNEEKEPIIACNGSGNDELIEKLDKLNSYAILPLSHKGEVIGMLTLDKKASKNIFSKTDFDLLLQLAEQAAEIHKREIKFNENIQSLEKQIRSLREESMLERERLNEQTQAHMKIIKTQESVIEHLKEFIIKQTISQERVLKARKPVIDESEFIAESPQMRSIIAKLQRIALLDFPILITGAPGNGKLHLARYIHRLSGRKYLKIVDCLNLNQKNIEEAITLQNQNEGEKIDSSNLTIILKNIDLLDLNQQLILYRIIETGSLKATGGTGVLFKPRYISTSSKNLEHLARAGAFNSALYNIISTFSYHIPPLRERHEDMVALADLYLILFNYNYDKNVTLPQNFIENFKSRLTQNNVIDLRNEIEKLVKEAKPPEPVKISDISKDLKIAEITRNIDREDRENSDIKLLEEEESDTMNLRDILHNVERETIIRALRMTKKQKDAARLLGLPPSTLNEKMKKLGIEDY